MRARGLCWLNTLAALSACASGGETQLGTSTGYATTCSDATYEAETMYHSTGGPTTDGWNIWSNGYISQDHDFADSQVTITVMAAGDVAANVWPHMVVSVGGTPIGDAYVNTATWAPYAFNYAATAGVQEIRVTFDNDYYANGEDRNLLADKVTVTCALPSVCNGQSGFVLTTPLSLDKTSVAIGQTITGTATYTNCTNAPISVNQLVVAGRPPGGTHQGGPWLDFSPYMGATTVASGNSVTVTASRTMSSSDPTGQWYSFATYEDSNGVYHDGPNVYFTVTAAAGLPAGWLYTNGNKIYVSDGAGGGTQWMGRGVNVSDLFFCGYNSGLWMSNPQATLENVFSGLMSGWHPTFARMSLSMHSGYGDKDWNTNDTTYTVPTTNAINFLGSYSNMRVLVTLRSHSSMTETDAGNEATYIPTTNTDATYRALVDTFANSKFVIFGISNEPGTISWSSLAPVMDHAVSVIRNEEDQLKVPHHLVAVQGIHWTSDISYYDSSPLPYDNVVYEVHGYEPSMTSYTKSNIPVIIGEYGPTSQTHDGTVSSAFLADIEAKQIPNLAWTFEPYSNCEPSLLLTTHDSSNLTPTTWGNQVQSYLLQHNP